ncbi:MAG: AI-2E family transporter [Acetobacteraceae bacterium]|nr:AI-2E family transporter [Acetobacteraceae bacterium]MBV8524938.1 AI-2E family transporter [Acetobacteraceae bacterium]MBV8590517.1 AI-2E family transporter [Acetobacteraceae bacterium]
MDDSIRLERQRGDRALRAMVAIVTTILTVAALGITQSVFAPLSFALFIIAIVWPLQSRLQAWMPKLVALTLTMLTTVAVILGFAWVVTWGFARVAHYVVGEVPRLQIVYNQWDEWLEGHGIAVASLWVEHFNMGWLLRVFHRITIMANGALSFALIVVIYVILGLLEIDDAVRRLRSMRTRKLGIVLLAGGARTAIKFRRYMLVRSVMSVVTGIFVWGLIWLFGVPLAVEWGVIAFALNYVPFIGPLVATVLPSLFAAAQLAVWQDAILIFGCLNFIQFFTGNYLEPLIAGSVLSMSPFFMLFAIFFWTYLWGIPGTFIGVPIVIAMQTICEQHESSRWLADLLGGADSPRE